MIYVYDLETTSIDKNRGRIMQFAGQLTDNALNPIGDPDNVLVKLSDDVIPEPGAILVHGITPQKTLEEGMTEAEFTDFFIRKIALPDTVFIGYNNLRFDDEFIRRINYRTFHDPYQWHWKDGRGRWDMLDATRMWRDLRPEGAKWPMFNGKPSVRLELMAKENNLTHENAHDALSDVVALIELTRMFKEAQPKLYDYLFSIRDKKSVARIVESGQPFVYTSGKYSNDGNKTTVVSTLFKHPERSGSVLVYDLREDPTVWLDKSVEELAKHWQARRDDDLKKLPVKALQYNHCPAIAPMGVLDDATKERLSIDIEEIQANLKILKKNPDLQEKLKGALKIVEEKQQKRFPPSEDVDDQMYDGFWNDRDQAELLKVRETKPEELSEIMPDINNKRIRDMIPPYRARNFPKTLTSVERQYWNDFRMKKFTEGGENSLISKFSDSMSEIRGTQELSKKDEYLLTETQLYVENIMPEPTEPEPELSDA